MDAVRGQLLGLSASESMNLVFTMNAAERTLLGISRESDEVVPLARLVGTPLAFCVLDDGKVCVLERDARQPLRRAFLVYDIDTDAVDQTVQLKEKEKEGKRQSKPPAPAPNGNPLYQNVNDEEVITALRLGKKQQERFESDTVVMRPDSAIGSSIGQDEGFQQDNDDSQKISTFVYRPICTVPIEVKDASNERADVLHVERASVVIALAGRKSVSIGKVMRNLDNQQVMVPLTKQKLRERVASCSFNRATRLIAVIFRDNSVTLYDTMWVARSNFACIYNGNPIELRSVAFTSMRTAIATVQVGRSASNASSPSAGQPAARGSSAAPRTEFLFADATGNDRQLRFFAASAHARPQNALESSSILLMPEWNRVLALVLDHSGAPAPAVAEYAIDYDYVVQA